MPAEPSVKRTVAFFDGQNLFHAAKKAFGHTFPNFDPLKLAEVRLRGPRLESRQGTLLHRRSERPG